MANNYTFQKAVPVWAEGLEKEMNITCGFYAGINKTQNKNFHLYITASTLYRVFINGNFCFFGPVRCGHGFYRVDELEITSFLHDGVNSVSVEVAGYNVNSYYVLDQSSFLQAEICEEEKVIAFTDKKGSFSAFLLNNRVQKVPRYSFQRAFSEAYRFNPSSNLWRIGDSTHETPVTLAETERKSLIKRGLPLHTFPKTSPKDIISKGKVRLKKPDTFTKGRWVTDISDTLKGFREEELEIHLSDEVQYFDYYEKTPVSLPYDKESILHENEYQILKFQCEKTGFLEVKIKCQKTGTLYLTFDESLKNDVVDPLCKTCLNAIRLDAEQGDTAFLSFEPYSMLYLNLTCIKGDFVLNDISIVEYVCPVPFVTDYKGTDPKLKRIFDAAKETFAQNAADNFMDCPSRERAGWLCDSFFTARTESLLTGKNRVEKVFLENFALPENFKCLPKGMLPMCYPSDHYNGVFIPNWAMWFVSELEDYLKRTNDRQMIDRFKEKVYLLLEYFKAFENEYNLLENLKGWIFIEWSKANELVRDVNYPSNMAYSCMLKAAGRLYNDHSLTEKSEKIAETIRNRSYDGTFFVDNEIRKDGKLTLTGERTETCQYYAFFFDIASPKSYPELWKRLTDKFGPRRQEKKLYPEIYPSNAFIGNYMRLDILTRYGLKEQCLSEITDYFLYMVEKTGTLWENVTDYASCNHGFASYAAYLIDKNSK